jgi:hypothetical protein
MTSLTSEHLPSKQRLLRDLNAEYRDTQEALNHTQASLTRAIRLAEQNYQRKRKAILANGHDTAEQRT